MAQPKPPRWSSSCPQIVDQSEWISHVAPRKGRLVLNDRAASLNESPFGFFDIGNGDLQNRTQGRASLDELIDVRAAQADQIECSSLISNPRFLA